MERQQQQQDRFNKFKPTKLATLWWVWTCPETLLLRLSSSKGNSNFALAGLPRRYAPRNDHLGFFSPLRLDYIFSQKQSLEI